MSKYPIAKYKVKMCQECPDTELYYFYDFEILDTGITHTVYDF